MERSIIALPFDPSSNCVQKYSPDIWTIYGRSSGYRWIPKFNYT